jgi:hypothetical protein
MPSVAKVAVGAVAGSVFLAREERHHSLVLLEWLRDDSVDLSLPKASFLVKLQSDQRGLGCYQC